MLIEPNGEATGDHSIFLGRLTAQAAIF